MGVIVVGTDGSPNGQAAVNWAAAEAVRRGDSLRVVYAWHFPYAAIAPSPIGTAAPPFELMEDAAREALDGFLETVALPADLEVERVVREGSASKILIAEAEGADLLVVGARGHGGFAGLLLGSVASQVANHVRVPVAIVPAES